MRQRSQRFRSIAGNWIFGLIVSLSPASIATSQTVNPFFTDQPGGIQQVSLAKETKPSAGTSHGQPGKQLRVSIRYLLVDDQSRRELYAELPAGSIHRATHSPPESSAPVQNPDLPTQQCQTEVSCHGHSATCVINADLANDFVKAAQESPTCIVKQVPGLVLQQNHSAEVRDSVQRPMSVDVIRESGKLEPVVRTVNEGTTMQLSARLIRRTAGSDAMQLTARIESTRILSIDTVELIGIADQPTTLQNPLCRTTRIIATETLAIGQLLLIDPHDKRKTTIDVESDSMLGKLPVVGRAFAETEPKEVENNLLVLIKPVTF